MIWLIRCQYSKYIDGSYNTLKKKKKDQLGKVQKTWIFSQRFLKHSSKMVNMHMKRCCCCCCQVASVLSDSVRPIDGSPPGSPVPGILQTRTLEWVAISFSNAGEWKVKVKSLSCVRLLATPWTAAYQAPPSMGFSRQKYWSGVPLPSPWKDARHH